MSQDINNNEKGNDQKSNPVVNNEWMVKKKFKKLKIK